MMTGFEETPPMLPVTCTVPGWVAGVQMVKSGMPPALRRFQVPAQRAPVVGLMSTRLILELP
jgi:hypothetical protein